MYLLECAQKRVSDDFAVLGRLIGSCFWSSGILNTYLTLTTDVKTAIETAKTKTETHTDRHWEHMKGSS